MRFNPGCKAEIGYELGRFSLQEEPTDFMVLLVHVDDFVVAAENTGEISKSLCEVQTYWKLSEIGEIGNILGAEVVKGRSIREIPNATGSYRQDSQTVYDNVQPPLP